MAVSGISGTSAASLANSRQSIADNFDTFLSLLTTQLKNQNPLDPLDTNQFTQQLVQFTSVEQQLKTNDFLSALVSANSSTANTGAVGYIGRTVTANGTRSELSEGKAVWSFNLKDAADVTVTIKNASGNVVFTSQGALQAGEGQFRWDGKGSDGLVKPDGTYSITMEGRNSSGALVPISTDTTGIVTGVDFTGTEPVLLVGAARLNLSSIKTVIVPS